MSISRISTFNWDKLLSRADCAEVKKAVNVLRGKSNEISASAVKYVKDPAPVDFAAYRKKLKFTASAVDTLENVYKNKKLPKYHATLPAFDAKKRELMLNVARSTVEAAKVDIVNMDKQLELFEQIRMTDETSIAELRDRFPAIAKEIETEINEHNWTKDSR